MSEDTTDTTEFRDMESKTWKVIGPIILAVAMATGGFFVTTNLGNTAARLERHEDRLLKVEAAQSAVTQEMGAIRVHLEYIKATSATTDQRVAAIADKLTQIRDWIRPADAPAAPPTATRKP